MPSSGKWRSDQFRQDDCEANRVQFRFKALAKRRDPDRLDAPMLLASPKGWIITLVLASCFTMIGGWAALGRLPQTVVSTGILMYPGGIDQITSPASGQLSAVHIEPGKIVEANMTVATLRQGSRTIQVASDISGRVVQVALASGSMIEAGHPIVSIEPGYSPQASLEAHLLVSAESIGFVQPGQSVLLTVSGQDPRRHGMLRGTVSARAAFPESTKDHSVGPTRVTVMLERSRTPSGYAWTSAEGPSASLESQTPVTAEIVVGEQSPLQALTEG